jgi:hypothetical protein
MIRRIKLVSLLSVLGLCFSLFSGCKNRSDLKPPLRAEKPIPVTTPRPTPTLEPEAKLPPATSAEVADAVHRIFGDDLVLAQGSAASFIVGDFNGDGSEDVAVIARAAAGKLNDINSELANWTIQDADKYFVPPAGKRVVTVKNLGPSKLSEGEEFLAIIHGFGAKGWRNPIARQAYLVKQAAATFTGIAPSVSQKSIRAMRLPIETDIIMEIRNKKKGFLFWTGGNYAWHLSES